MRLERSRIQATRLALEAAADLARRQPYRTRARPGLRRLAAFVDLVPELAWAARRRSLWHDRTGSVLVAYTTEQERRRSWWLAGLTFVFVLVVVLTAAIVATLTGIPDQVVYGLVAVLGIAAIGGRPVRYMRHARHTSDLNRYRQDLGRHTYVSFVYKPLGRSARSPVGMAVTLQQQGELVGPYVARAATEAHVRLYRRSGFELVEDAPTLNTSERLVSALMMLRGDLPVGDR